MNRIEFDGISQKLIQMHGERFEDKVAFLLTHADRTRESQAVQINMTLLELRKSVREVVGERFLPCDLGDRQFSRG